MKKSVPDVIVIGAQKSGTTTLYNDIGNLRSVYRAEKESGVLSRGGRASGPLRSEYARLFALARPEDTLVEVCADYTMYPKWPHVLDNLDALGIFPKVIYIVRDPIKRALSHYRHDLAYGLTRQPLEVALHEDGAILETSRYATQLAPWFKYLGSDSVLVVRFEDYMGDRKGGLSRIADFIGVDSANIDPGAEIHNKSDTMAIPSAQIRKLAKLRLYRHYLRPLIPDDLRKSIIRLLSPKAPDAPAPSQAVLDFLVREFSSEVDELAGMLGESPWWDLRQYSSGSGE